MKARFAATSTPTAIMIPWVKFTRNRVNHGIDKASTAPPPRAGADRAVTHAARSAPAPAYLHLCQWQSQLHPGPHLIRLQSAQVLDLQTGAVFMV